MSLLTSEQIEITKQKCKIDRAYEQLHGIEHTFYLLYGTSTVLYWTPGTKNVHLVSEKDFANVPTHCYTRWVAVKASTPDTLLKRVLLEAMHLIVRENCCPHAVHAALSRLRKYATSLADDMPYSIREQR